MGVAGVAVVGGAAGAATSRSPGSVAGASSAMAGVVAAGVDEQRVHPEEAEGEPGRGGERGGGSDTDAEWMVPDEGRHVDRNRRPSAGVPDAASFVQAFTGRFEIGHISGSLRW